MKLDEYCDVLAAKIVGASTPEEMLAVAAEGLRAPFRVRPDEVTIFFLDPQLQVLRFLWPRHLQRAGFIPLVSRQSLVARTYLEKHPIINNHFASATHLSLFETVPEKKGKGDKDAPQPIQKIISAPIGRGKEICGVAQVCRKGTDPDKAGADFSPTDLKVLSHLAEMLGEHMEGCSLALPGSGH
jgi:hypothetical protein